MKTQRLTTIIVLTAFSVPAMAYIDPGSGSVIMSAIIGFFVALGMAIKTYWYKLKSFFTGKKPTNTKENTPQEQQSE